MQDAKEILEDFQSEFLVRRKYNETYGKKLTERRAKEIASAFRQGKEYLGESAKASPRVVPLLVFYGLQALTRGVTQYLSHRDAGGLSNSHGLTVEGWAGVVYGQQPDLAKLSVRAMPSGTLREFLETTENSSIIGTHEFAAARKINISYSHGNIPPEYTLTMEDLLSRLPIISNTFFRTHQNKNSFAFLPHHDTNNDPTAVIEIANWGLDSDSTLRKVSEIINLDPNTLVTKHKQHDRLFQVDNPFNKLPHLWNSYCHGIDAGPPLMVRNFDSNFMISEFAASYALAYILSSLCRYYPGAWDGIFQGGINNSMLPVINETVTYLQTAAVSCLLNYLHVDISPGWTTDVRDKKTLNDLLGVSSFGQRGNVSTFW